MNKEHVYLFIKAKSAIFLLLIGLVCIHVLKAQIWFKPQASLSEIKEELEKTGGANIDARNSLGQTGLMQAINYGRFGEFGSYDRETDLVELLIKYGADVNALSEKSPREEDHSYNNTPLHYVSIQTNFRQTAPLIDYLIDEGAEVNVKNNLGETPLMWTANLALLDDNRSVTRAFIADLADVNLQNNRGDTYLHILINDKDYTWVQELIDKFGSMFDLSIKNNEGWTPMDYAVNTLQPESQRAIESLKLVGDNDKVKDRDTFGRTGLMLAIIRNDEPFALSQIKYKSDLDATDTTRFKNAPLHLAVIRNSNIAPFVKMLVDNKADQNIKNAYGDTPLHYLVKFNIRSPERDAVAQLLIDAGANPSEANSRGQTVIAQAKKVDPGFAQRLEQWYKAKQDKQKEPASTKKVPEVTKPPVPISEPPKQEVVPAAA